MRSDALSGHEAEENGWSRGPCLAHGRRQVSALEDLLPLQSQGVLEVLKQVVDPDDEAREPPREPEARWAYPQAFSQPLMDALKHWLQKPVDGRRVEPNRSRGQAMADRQSHWKTLPRCGSIPGAPLDPN